MLFRSELARPRVLAARVHAQVEDHTVVLDDLGQRVVDDFIPHTLVEGERDEDKVGVRAASHRRVVRAEGPPRRAAVGGGGGRDEGCLGRKFVGTVLFDGPPIGGSRRAVRYDRSQQLGYPLQ